MKKLLILCTMLMLTSCIEVEDFGDTWSKGSIDPAFAGTWEKVSELDEKTPTGQTWIFTVKDDAYQVETFVRGKKPDEDGPIYPVKTITVGPYTFLAKGPEQGSILRYVMTGDTTIYFVLNPKHALTYIRKNYPDQEAFYQGDPEDVQDDEEITDESLKMVKFNDEAFKILSNIPDSEMYWEPDSMLKKVK